MAVQKNIGKNTIGDNKKMEVNLRTYNRSTHNLSTVIRNTQSVGTKQNKLNKYIIENEIATIAVRRFLERWRKKYKKSARHFLISLTRNQQ